MTSIIFHSYVSLPHGGLLKRGYPYMNHPKLNRIVMDFPLQTIHFGVPPFLETTIWKLAPSDR